MNILFLIDSIGSGGAQKQMVQLAKEFKQRGHNLSFLVYHKEDFYKDYLTTHGIAVFEILESNYILRILKMRRFIRGGEYNAVLSFLEASSFIATVSGFPLRKWKLVVGERSANPNILKSRKLRFYRWFHVFADYVVANSHANIDIIRSINPFLKNKKCKVIYNLLDVTQLEEVKAKYSGCFVLLVAASHRKLKNLNGLIEGVNKLPEDIKKQLKIRWFGQKDIDSSYREGLAKIEKYGLTNIFEFHDSVPDLRSHFEAADAIGLFSFYEGFPNFVCEGLALGKPVICTPVSDLPLVLKDSENVLFCEPDEASSITTALLSMMNMEEQKRKTMIEANFKVVKRYFDKERIVDEYLELLSNDRQ